MQNKFNYKEYKKEIDKIVNNPTLKKYGIKKYTLGKTNYLYDIDYITIGKGDKDIFLVGGTHGNEIITTNFILQLLNNFNLLNEFDPNIFTLKILPLQNPEGYDISTNTFGNILEEDFNKKSYEYYLRYRNDNIISRAIKDLRSSLLEVPNDVTSILLKRIQNFITTNINWLALSQNNVFPNINILNKYIMDIKDTSSIKVLCGEIIMALRNIEDKLDKNNLQDMMYFFFLRNLEELFIDILVRNKNNNRFPKLHQEMFSDNNFSGLNNKNLELDISKMMYDYKHPLGSQINFEATGMGINLNANTPLNPGIMAMKNNKIIYGYGAKDNVRKYVKGPIGVPCDDYNNFSIAKENLLLENLIKTSFKQNRLTSVLLFHATGGEIYYKPYQDIMNDHQYYNLLEYNQALASIYSKDTNYRLLNSNDTSGYGDYLRRTYPGVLLIELSKMGGNPLGPYGDINNIDNVYNTNITALNNLIKYLKDKNTKKIVRK